MPGTNGEVANSYLQKSELSRSQKDMYPLPLLKVMTRYAEDLVWANKTADAEAVLTFLVNVTDGRSDSLELKKREYNYQSEVIQCKNMIMDSGLWQNLDMHIAAITLVNYMWFVDSAVSGILFPYELYLWIFLLILREKCMM